MEINSIKDISVFTFARGSQLNPKILESESFSFVMGIIDKLMIQNGVDTPKVGLGGTKEDVCCFIAGLIEYQHIFKDCIVYTQVDVAEFDPDDNPEVYDVELG